MADFLPDQGKDEKTAASLNILRLSANRGVICISNHLCHEGGNWNILYQPHLKGTFLWTFYLPSFLQIHPLSAIKIS